MTDGRPKGMTAFVVIWSGQMLSATATRMINFALGIWVWQQTGRASALALMTLLAFAATVSLSPFAGGLVDRWSRRASIVMSDVGSLATTAVALLLFATGTASFLPLILVNTVTGAFLAFQYPAYSALVTSLVSKERYVRANGMISMVRSAPAIFAPGIAAVLMTAYGIWCVLLVALGAFVAAIATVLVVDLPGRPDPHAAKGGAFWGDLVAGFRYIGSDAGLLGLQSMGFVVSLVSAMGFVLLTPLVLTLSGNSEAQLGAVTSIGAVGGFAGAVLVSTVKPPGRKVLWLLWAALAFCVFGRVLMGATDTFVVWAVAWFVSWLSVPFIEAYSLTIWQQKVPLALQGRVFGAVQTISQLALLIGFSATGLLVDGVFTPAGRSGTGIAAPFRWLIGVGPAAGMRLVFVLAGLLGVVAAVAALLTRKVRDLETRLPDQGTPAAEPEPQEAMAAAEDGRGDER